MFVVATGTVIVTSFEVSEDEFIVLLFTRYSIRSRIINQLKQIIHVS